MSDRTPEKKVPWPRDLKRDEVIVIERRMKVDGKWGPWHPFGHVYGPGCEHDAHGVCTVTTRHNPVHLYRLSIFKRLVP